MSSTLSQFPSRFRLQMQSIELNKMGDDFCLLVNVNLQFVVQHVFTTLVKGIQ